MISHTDHELSRLANQVLWPGFLGHTVPDWLARELTQGLAGVLYFSHNLSSPTANRALAEEIYRHNPQPLIGVDEEGGNVTRFEADTGSNLPSAAQLGYINDPQLTQYVGTQLAGICTRGRANVVLAPVADVNTNPRNPVIGVRSFGSSAERVATHVRAMTLGIQSNGIAACAKHWPGHGDTELDSHLSTPTVSAGVYQEHLAPFRAAIDAGVAMIMTAHIVVPEWGHLPGTINPAAIGALRSGEFDGGAGYEGVIVSDALDMAAIRKVYGMGQGAIQALAAGVDLLCIGNPANPGREAVSNLDEQDFLTVRDAIVAAVKSGELPYERLAQAALRVKNLAHHLHSDAAHLPSVFGSTYDHILPQLQQRERVFITITPPGPDVQHVESRSAFAELGAQIRSWPQLDLRPAPSLAQFDSHHSVPWQLSEGNEHAAAQTVSEVEATLTRWQLAPGAGLIVIVDSTMGRQQDLVAMLSDKGFSIVVINTGLPGRFEALTTVNTRGSSQLTRNELTRLLKSS